MTPEGLGIVLRIGESGHSLFLVGGATMRSGVITSLARRRMFPKTTSQWNNTDTNLLQGVMIRVQLITRRVGDVPIAL